MAKREEWIKRIERWKDSGLTAREYAAEAGLTEKSLHFWSWKLRKERTQARAPSRSKGPLEKRHVVPSPMSFVEVMARPSAFGDAAFEVVLGSVSVKIPPSFDEHALRRLLAVIAPSRP
jgi:transposase